MLVACGGGGETPAQGGAAMTPNGGGAGESGTIADPNAPMGTAGSSAVPNQPVDPMGNPVQDLDPGRVAIRRLSNFEYNNTVQDLLGSALRPADTFLREEGLGFDNHATSLGVTPQQYESYFNAAKDLTLELQSNPAQWGLVSTCTPVDAADVSCAQGIITAFGAKAWRRPLDATEVALFTRVYQEGLTAGEDHAGAIRHVVATMLQSAQFLYRIELDADPSSLVPHPLTGYELASRLSYFLWSSMPNDALFALAAADGLSTLEAVLAQVGVMLTDAKASRLIEGFAGQWLGIRDLATQHAVATDFFPTWTETLRAAMVEEEQQFFAEFLTTTRPMTEFLTADINFVNPELATHYGMPAPAAGVATRVEVTTDDRRGFLGLGGFLTLSSYDYRTSPVLRARWILDDLLCSPPPPPPGNVPTLEEGLDDAANAAALVENVRERLELHRTNPTCAACHEALDPFGLGLENYDAIGAYRTTYPNGDPIRADGVLPDGTAFDGLVELSALLSQDPRFTNCAMKKLFIYATGRGETPADAPYFTQVSDAWHAQGLTLRALIDNIAINDTFRFRRGEVAPP